MWLHVHSVIILNHMCTLAGSGFHLRSVVHTPLILPAGTNPGLHLKNISAPSVVVRYESTEPFVGEVGPLQLTVKRKEEAYHRSNAMRRGCMITGEVQYSFKVQYSFRVTAMYAMFYIQLVIAIRTG